MTLESLKDLYLQQLRDLHSAEMQLVQALPKMAAAATSARLKSAFREHLNQTRQHVERLEKIFDKLGVSARGEACEGMKGLIQESERVIAMRARPDALDAADAIDARLIAAAQRLEHYEIAGYGTVRTYAELLGDQEALHLLERTLQEEEETDDCLTEIVESTINEEALLPAAAMGRVTVSTAGGVTQHSFFYRATAHASIRPLMR